LTAAVDHLVRQPHKEDAVQTYVILRRRGWKTGDDLKAAAERSTEEGERMADDVRWIRSYVLEEQDGEVGTVCIYQATSPEAIRRHAENADLPADEVIAVGDVVLVRPDPVSVTT
jgi:sporulation protein YlmC with PRC-barrel domain